MTFREKLVNIESRWSWSFFGFLLAIIFGGIAIYTSFFEDKNPNLEFIVESKTSVLDLNKNIENLDILYKGINIKKQNKNLSILSIKVVNNSSVNILQGFYDDLSKVSISVKNGNVVDKPYLIDTSNEYLKKNINIKLDSTGCIYLPKLIIEGQEYYTISILVLHKNGFSPQIISAGKIAGQKDGIKVVEVYKSNNEPTFWKKLIYGDFLIHVIRFLGYLLLFLFFILLILIPSDFIIENSKKRRKKNIIKKYIKRTNVNINSFNESIFDLYQNFSLDFLLRTQKLIQNEVRIKLVYENIVNNEKIMKNIIKTDKNLEDDNSPLYKTTLRGDEFVVSELKNLNILKTEKNNIFINKEFFKELNDFISYLKLL